MVASIFDDFNRPDESLHGSQSAEGWPWIADADLAIVSGEVKSTGSGSSIRWALADTDIDSSEHFAEATFGGNSPSREFGIIICATSLTDHYYAWLDHSGDISIRRRDSDSPTTLASGTVGSTGGTWRLERAGDTLKLRRNGVIILEATDPGTLHTGTKAGLHVSRQEDSVYADDFSAAVLASPDTPTGLTAEARDHESVNLNWNEAAGADSYEIRQDGVSIGTTTDTSFTAEGLNGGTAYSFEVRGVNDTGNSEWSDPSLVTTPVFALVRRETSWHFDAVPDDHGVYCNGDHWIVPPAGGINVVKITVGDGIRVSGDLPGRDGSQKNLTGWDTQSLDSDAGFYREEDALYPPFAVEAGDRLLSAWSAVEDSTYVRNHASGHEPYLLTIEMLTVVGSAPAADAFRPPYIGTDLGYRLSDMDLSVLPAYAPPSDVPDITDLSKFERPWVDLLTSPNAARYFHADRNMASYGRELARDSNGGVLALAFDLANRDDLAMQICQIGLDLYGQASAGRDWNPDGGHWFGRKLPILLAGKLLDDANMLDVADSTEFQEDGQAFYVTQEDVDRVSNVEVSGNPQAVTSDSITLSTSVPLGDNDYILNGLDIKIVSGPGAGQRRTITSYAYDSTRVADITPSWDAGDLPTTDSVYQVFAYEAEDIGLAEYGLRHSTAPERTNPSLASSYRSLTGRVYVNMALAALLHDLRAPWSHDAFFDYINRFYYDITDEEPSSAWGMDGEAWETHWDVTYAAAMDDPEPETPDSEPTDPLTILPMHLQKMRMIASMVVSLVDEMSHPMVTVAPKPVAWWDFENGGVDASGNGYDLTNSGSSDVEGVFGRGRTFDGVDDNMRGTSSNDLSGWNDFTVAFWAKMGSLPDSGANYVVNVFDSTSDQRSWACVARGGQSQWSLFLSKDGSSNDTNVVTIPFSSVSAGEWHHYAFRRIGSEVAALLDGEVVSTAVYDGSLFAADAQPALGAMSSLASGTFWAGTLDEVKVFNKQGLSNDDVKRLIKGLKVQGV